MWNPTRRGRRRGERGAAAVEFALVMPILFLVFFALVNFGFVFAQQLALDNAARQAARFAVVDVEGRACGDIAQEAADAYMLTGTPTFAMSGASGPCESPCEGAAPNTDLTVEYSLVADVLIPIPPFPDTFDLTGEGVFRCEYS